MNASRVVTVGVVACCLMAAVSEVQAGRRTRALRKKAKVNTERKEKMDRNDDGRVSAKEVHAAKTHQYIKNKSTVDTKWEAKADSDGDGSVSASELRTHQKTVMDKNNDGAISDKERAAFWLKRKSKANTDREKKYDTDGNGWLSGSEAKEMLKDTIRVVKTRGRAKVNTDLEREYDINGDGVIDREEAEAMRDAAG